MTEDAPLLSLEKPAGSCGGSRTKFSYCFWAKLLVAIPVLPFIAAVAAMQFTNPPAQIAAAIVAVGVVVWAARAVDRMPALSGMVFKRK